MTVKFYFFLGISLISSINSQVVPSSNQVKVCTCADGSFFMDSYPFSENIPEGCVCEDEEKSSQDNVGGASIVLSPEDELILENYRLEHNITFNTIEEKLNALVNLRVVFSASSEINDLYAQNKSNFISAIYPFSHLSPEMLEKTMCGSAEAEEEEKFIFNYTRPEGFEETPFEESPVYRRKRAVSRMSPECQNLPAYKNWAEEGKTTTVMNQEQCGCCYIFASLTVIESRVSIASRKIPLKLSRQHSLECVKEFTLSKNRDGCKGGRPEWVWQDAKEKIGIVPEASHYPYNTNQNGACIAEKPRDVRAETDHQIRVRRDEDEMMCHVALHGPLYVSIYANGTFYNYKGGIWDDPLKECTSPDYYTHAVAIVGYGSEIGKTGEKLDYWIVQNSWGSDWGENGFIKMKRGVNLCAITADVFYPVLKSALPILLKPIYTPVDCIVKENVYSANGTYLKSFCIDVFWRNFENSRVNCLRQGMQLFQFDSSEATEKLSLASKKQWTDNYFANDLHVAKGKLNDQLLWTNNVPFGPFKVVPGNASLVRQSVCEYLDFDLLPKQTTTASPTTTTARTTTAAPTTTKASETTAAPTTTAARTTTAAPTTTVAPTTTAAPTTTTRTASTTTTRTQTTTSTTTTAATTPKIPLLGSAPWACKNVRDLKDSNGVYLKTACTVYQNYNQNTARSHCAWNGMQLYKFFNAEDEMALLAYADSQWPLNRLWVDGGNSSSGLMISNYNRQNFAREYMPVTSTYSYFYCEYKITTPKINALLEPVEVPSVCTWIKNIRNPSGVYLKTVCYVPLARNQDQARKFCADSGTNLLVLDSPEYRASLFDYSDRQFISAWILWVEGRNSSGCTSIKKFSKFTEKMAPCTTTYYFFCEYKKIADNLP